MSKSTSSALTLAALWQKHAVEEGPSECHRAMLNRVAEATPAELPGLVRAVKLCLEHSVSEEVAAQLLHRLRADLANGVKVAEPPALEALRKERRSLEEELRRPDPVAAQMDVLLELRAALEAEAAELQREIARLQRALEQS